MKKIITCVYVIVTLAIMLGVIISLFIHDVPQFAVANILLLIWIILDFIGACKMPYYYEVHSSLFKFGTYSLLMMFAGFGSMGYLIYYNMDALAVLYILYYLMLILNFGTIIKLPTKDNLQK